MTIAEWTAANAGKKKKKNSISKLHGILNEKMLSGYDTVLKKTIYGEGTVFILTNHHDGMTEREAFILARCYEEGKVFQIIQLTGLHSGCLLGYVKHSVLGDSETVITHDELIEAIRFNFIGPDFNTLQVINNRLELTDLNI